MDTTALSAAFIGAKQGLAQTNLAASLLRNNAKADAAIANLLDASAQSSLAAGVGGHVNKTA
ncbi:MAG TPA: hypothetical protein VHN11_07205 [Xanthobacteraceae bacterium]|jgi:hypothetical protein|nr:hypothetical protein [Xanthobacteraceae bacterium]